MVSAWPARRPTLMPPPLSRLMSLLQALPRRPSVRVRKRKREDHVKKHEIPLSLLRLDVLSFPSQWSTFMVFNSSSLQLFSFNIQTIFYHRVGQAVTCLPLITINSILSNFHPFIFYIYSFLRLLYTRLDLLQVSHSWQSWTLFHVPPSPFSLLQT